MLAALALCAVLLVSLVPAARAAQADGQLQFDENGEFRILIVADTQDIDKPQKETLALLEAELDAAQPDLVVFLGDQIHGPSTGRSVERTQKALDAILQPVAARELPFAVVFGNHDDEGGVDKQTQLEYYRSYPGCLAEAGSVTGVGNYNLLVYGSDGASPAVNLWFFDSGTYAPEGQGSTTGSGRTSSTGTCRPKPPWRRKTAGRPSRPTPSSISSSRRSMTRWTSFRRARRKTARSRATAAARGRIIPPRP